MNAYPVTLEIDYPQKGLDRVTTFLRPVMIIPIVVVLGLVSGPMVHAGQEVVAEAGGIVFAATVLMLVFRQKYPRWWFDWNLALAKFGLRVAAYGTLLRDEYPSTDEEQAVHVELGYPDAVRDLNRWMPLVKWFLAIPHYLVLALLCVGAAFSVVGAWLAILFTGTYPRALFEFVVGVLRWWLRIAAYAFLLTTDRYPPFRLST
jgi:hypothetical protein